MNCKICFNDTWNTYSDICTNCQNRAEYICGTCMSNYKTFRCDPRCDECQELINQQCNGCSFGTVMPGDMYCLGCRDLIRLH